MDVVIRTSSIAGFPLPGMGIRWSIALCVLFYITFLVGMVLLVTTFLLMLQPGEVSIDVFSLMVAPQLVAWTVALTVGLKWSSMSFREARFELSFPLRIVPALLITSVGAAVVLVEVVLWVPMPESFRYSIVEASQQAPFLSIFVPLVIVAPVAEEFFFRGLLFRDFLERYSVVKSVWATAVMFSLFHLNPWQAVVALPLGFWFAFLVLRTGSIVPGIICHATYNFSTAFVLKPFAFALGYTAADWKAAEHIPPRLLAIGTAMTIVGAVFLWRRLSGTNAVRIVASCPLAPDFT